MDPSGRFYSCIRSHNMRHSYSAGWRVINEIPWDSGCHRPCIALILSLESRWNVTLLIVLSWSLTLVISSSISNIFMVPKRWCVVGR